MSGFDLRVYQALLNAAHKGSPGGPLTPSPGLPSLGLPPTGAPSQPAVGEPGGAPASPIQNLLTRAGLQGAGLSLLTNAGDPLVVSLGKALQAGAQTGADMRLQSHLLQLQGMFDQAAKAYPEGMPLSMMYHLHDQALAEGNTTYANVLEKEITAKQTGDYYKALANAQHGSAAKQTTEQEIGPGGKSYDFRYTFDPQGNVLNKVPLGPTKPGSSFVPAYSGLKDTVLPTGKTATFGINNKTGRYEQVPGSERSSLDQKPITQKVTDALSLIRGSENVLDSYTAPDGTVYKDLFKALSGPKAQAYQHGGIEGGARLLGIDTKDLTRYQLAAQRKDDIANSYAPLLAGRVSLERIKLTMRSLLPNPNDTPQANAAKWDLFKRFRKVQSQIFSGTISQEEARRRMDQVVGPAFSDFTNAFVDRAYGADAAENPFGGAPPSGGE